MPNIIDTIGHRNKPYIVTGLVATGTNQATALLLANSARHEIDTVAAGTGVILPVGLTPSDITVFNSGLNALAIYPPAGGTINNGTVNASVALSAGAGMSFWAAANNNWNVTVTSATGSGSGTVTSVTIASANGFTGTVASSTTTPVVTLATSITGILKGNGTAIATATPNTDYQSAITLTTTGSGGTPTFNGTTLNIPAYTNNAGTVTTASVATANGFAGSVATATTTPAITITTSVTGVLKGNGTAIAAATAGTDYQAPVTLTTTGSGGTPTFSANTLNIPAYTNNAGTVTTFSVAALPSWLGSSVATATSTPALTLTVATGQTANQFLASPNGSTGAVGLRAIVAADLPTTSLQINSHYGVITADAPSAGAVTCNFTTSDKHSVTLVANTTFTFSSPLASGQISVVEVTQGGSGSYTATWPGTVDWGTAGAPALSTTVGKTDIFTFYWNGTNYRASTFGFGF